MTLAAALIAGCSILAPEPSEAILGSWSSEVRGYPVTVAYTDTTVTVDGGNPVSYSLEGDTLRYEGGGAQTRTVSFPSRNEMVLFDPLTGAEQRYQRLSD